MRQPLLWTCVAVTCILAPQVRAEVFLLTHGGRVEGEWRNKDGAPHETYEIETPDGGKITLSASQVAEVIVKSEVLRRYEELLPKVPDTVEGHTEMAERCRKAGLKSQREFHLRKVLELDPNNADAHRGLGYSQVDGEWIKADEWLKNQGYVRYKGAWRLPQEVELDARDERQSVEEKDWRKRLRRWRGSIVQGRDDSAESLAQLRAVDSPLAIAGLSELLHEDDEPTQLKLLYIELLGKFHGSAAAAALLERVMKDPELEVRERSIEALKKHGTHQAVAVLSRALKDKDNQVVNQAAWALGRLGAPEAIPALIEAITTKHRFQVQPGGGPGSINTGFSPTGGNALQAGGRPRIIEKELPNRHVLQALTLLTPDGINFSYDRQAWKNWFAHQQIEPGANLRRDM